MTLDEGSSPLARGTRAGSGFFLGAARLIPARTGNTALVMVRRLMNPAHPRSRGEHETSKNEMMNLSGSSPLTRGTLSHRTDSSLRVRLIPARAGNIQHRG